MCVGSLGRARVGVECSAQALGRRVHLHPAAARPTTLPAEKVGGEVVEAACVIELPALKGREKLEGLPLFVLIEKEGE